jgi:ribosomal protein L31
MFTILSHKRIAYQNDADSPCHPSYTGYREENKQQQMLLRMWKKEPSGTVGGSLN